VIQVLRLDSRQVSSELILEMKNVWTIRLRNSSLTVISADVIGLGRPMSEASVDINVIESGTEYEARVNQVDVRLLKILNISTQRIQVMFDVSNVLNENSITESDRFYGPNFQRPQAIMSGRLSKFTVQYNF
jgi:hypothetical protein